VDGGDTGIEVGCVVRVESGLLERSDLDVCRVDQLAADTTGRGCVTGGEGTGRSLDVVDQLAAGALLEDGEELVSNIIHIRASVVVSVSHQQTLLHITYLLTYLHTYLLTYLHTHNL